MLRTETPRPPGNLTSGRTHAAQRRRSHNIRAASYDCTVAFTGDRRFAAELPWLLDLATIQADSGAAPGRATYDDEQQMTYLLEPARELAIDSASGVSTKKADRETGEDQKGF